MDGLVGAGRLVARTLAKAIRPTKPQPFDEWLPENIKLVDGAGRGEYWSADGAPYLPEIAQCLSVDHPCNRVVVRKCQQSGVSILSFSWALYLAEMKPDNILYALPNADSLSKMNSQKLQPLIDKWQEATGKQVIRPDVSRSGKGSTTYEKKFADCSMTLANSNVVNDLSSITARWGIKDEYSKWQNTPKGDDPDELFEGRFTDFRRTKLYKIFEYSTCEVDKGDPTGETPGHCRVDASFQKSDQRYWHISCPDPDCGHKFVLGMENLKIDEDAPENSHCFCPECGTTISESMRVRLLKRGRWIALNEEVGQYPGFTVSAFDTLKVGLGDIAAAYIDAQKGDEAKKKNFHNLWLGLPYEEKGNAPDYERLMERREDYPRGVIPEQGLIFVGGADVQGYGIYVEATAYAPDRQSWVVEAEFLEGKTDNIHAGAWVKLDEFYRRVFKDAHGNARRLMALAVDGGDGGRMDQVLEWCKARKDCYAIKGQGGRHVPAISVPKKQSIRKSGKKKKFGSTMLWPVGTWGLKSDFYANLHLQGLSSGKPKDPNGYCHFGLWLGEEYFKQITAEYFKTEIKKFRLIEAWERLRKDNHFLDCRVYSMAMAEHMGLTRMTESQWLELRALLAPAQADLLSSDSAKLAAGLTPTKTETETVSEAKPAAAEGPTRHGTDKSKSSYRRRRQLV